MRKTNGHIKPFKQGLVFLLGLMVAVFVVTQEVLPVQCETIAEQQEQLEADQESEDQEEIHAYTFDAVLPAASISIEPFQAILLAEINFESDEKEYPRNDIPLCDSPFYKTLFRQIISPNAP